MPLSFTTLPALKLFAFVKNAAESLRSKFKNLIDLKLCLFVFFLFFSHFSFVKDERYCPAVKSLEFDRQLCPYNLKPVWRLEAFIKLHYKEHC